MDIEKVDELRQLAIRKMNSGNFDGALNLACQIKGLGSHYVVSYTASGILIDVGNAIGNEKIIREGVDLLKKDFEAIIHQKRLAPTAYYNLANGYYALLRFKIMKDPYFVCFRETELNKAISYYRKALSYELKDPVLASQIWVNLGNCFDHLGRVVDALECYDEALRLKPDHGMALGNKGQALLHYAVLSGEHEGTLIREAYSLLVQALRLGVPPEAVSSFSEHLKHIREHLADKQTLDNPPEYPGYKIKSKSEFERFLVEFCLENKLYLNICNFCQKCDAAIGDTAVIKKMIVQISRGKKTDFLKDNVYLHLSRYLNQIKQDYITARFLLILSRYKGLDLSFVDKRVRIINTLDYSTHNIRIQLVKTSFKVFYDILDKIACFINDYLKLGICETDISFQRIWYTKSRMIRREIADTKNLSLSALYNTHKDFEDEPNRRLKKIRHALTHRFVNIRVFQEQQGEKNMTEDELVKRTSELARMVRSAIIYLLHFVYAEETRKEAKIGEPLPSMVAHDLPDDLKTSK